MPRSYLSNEPACLRASRNKFDPIEQIHDRLFSLENQGKSGWRASRWQYKGLESFRIQDLSGKGVTRRAPGARWIAFASRCPPAYFR